jgi:hypothetical protein
MGTFKRRVQAPHIRLTTIADGTSNTLLRK